MTKISESEIIRNKNGIEHGTAQCSMHNRNNVNQMGKHTGRGEILHTNWNIFFRGTSEKCHPSQKKNKNQLDP